MDFSIRKKALKSWLSASVLVVSSGLLADMPVTFMPIDYVDGGHYGLGYDLRTGELKGNCVKFSSNDVYDSGNRVQKTFFDFTESTSEVAANSNLSVSSSLKVLGGATTYSANSKTSVTTKSETSTYNQTLLASVIKYNIPKYRYIENTSIKPAMLDYFNNTGGKGEFKTRCGDGFIIGVQYGREFVGTATVKKQTLKNSTKFANETGIGAKGAWGEAKASVDIAKAMEQSFGTNNIKVNTYSTGFDFNNPGSPTKMKEVWEKFLSLSQGQEQIAKLIIAPYNVLENYPYENPLIGNSKDDYIGMMVVGLWDLKAAVRDADFVLSPTTKSMFAIGSKRNKQKSRISLVKQYRNVWLKEYDQLLKAAQKCDTKYAKNQKACESLGVFYERYRNLAAEWDLVLPERYLCDCYTPITLDENSGLSRLEMALGKRKFSHIYGDSEMGGSKGRIVAALNYETDKRKLKANLSIARIEWKRKKFRGEPLMVRTKKGESGWAMQVGATVFDLDNTRQYGSDTNLKECDWVSRTGVTNRPKLRTPEPYKNNNFITYGFKKGKRAHGLVDGKSGKKPRGYVQFGGGKGLLSSIDCEIDRKGKDNNMKCANLVLKDVRLALVSKQDKAADRWRSPGKAAIPEPLVQFTRGKKVNAKAYKAKVSNSKTAKARARRHSTSIKSVKQPTYKVPSSQIKIMNKRLKVAPAKMQMKRR